MIESEAKETVLSVCMSLMILLLISLGFIYLVGCTVTFQNVMTSGTASAVADDSPAVNTNPNLTVPLKS